MEVRVLFWAFTAERDSDGGRIAARLSRKAGVEGEAATLRPFFRAPVECNGELFASRNVEIAAHEKGGPMVGPPWR